MAEILDPRQQDFSKEKLALLKMKNDLEKMLGEDGILILPPHSRVAPKHKAVLWTPFDFIYTGIFTALGMPATSVPTGLNIEGLPLGVQIVSSNLSDHATISAAEFLEQTFGGWAPAI
jgi:fatty acid amide hydrolase 2